jgi:hypothetical protein
MKDILSCVTYRTYQWHIFSDLNVIAMLMGRRSVTQNSVVTYVNRIFVPSVHYSKKNWPLRKSHTPGTKNIAHQPLVDLCKMLLPPVLIKLGLQEKFCEGIREKWLSILTV